MYKIIFFLLTIIFSLNGFAQNQGQGDTSINPKATLREIANGAEIVLSKVQHPPEFPGGDNGWADYLKKNINLGIPLKNKAVSGTYHVSIRYTIEKAGTIRNVGAETNCGYGMEAEVMRCIKSSPKWKPAETKNNEIVGFATRQLVIFKIKGSNIEIEIR